MIVPKPPLISKAPIKIIIKAPPNRITPWIKSLHTTPSNPPKNVYKIHNIPTKLATKNGFISDTDVMASVGK